MQELDVQRLDSSLEATTAAMDADIRQYYSLVMEFGTPEMRESTRREVLQLGAQFSEMSDTAHLITEFLEQIKPVEILNVPLRKALRPLRAGVVSTQVAMATMRSWGQLSR